MQSCLKKNLDTTVQKKSLGIGAELEVAHCYTGLQSEMATPKKGLFSGQKRGEASHGKLIPFSISFFSPWTLRHLYLVTEEREREREKTPKNSVHYFVPQLSDASKRTRQKVYVHSAANSLEKKRKLKRSTGLDIFSWMPPIANDLNIKII